LSGNGNVGEFIGGSKITHDNDGTAHFDFAGSADYVDANVSTEIVPWQTSYSFWMKGNGWNGITEIARTYSEIAGYNTKRFMARGRSSTEMDISYNTNGTNEDYQVFNYSGWHTTDWKHIVVVMDQPGGFSTSNGSTVTNSDLSISLYVNGVLNETKSALASMGNRNNPEADQNIDIITASTVGNTKQFELDDFRIYDRAITQAEITYLASKRGIEGSPDTPPPPSGTWHSPFRNSFFYNPFFDNEAL
jgi:hypothetical protein